jgi:hypothetical protein
LETLCKKHGEAIKKLKKENTTLELMVQSHDELVMEIAAETRLDKMGEDDDNDGGDVVAPLLSCHLLPLLIGTASKKGHGMARSSRQ